MTKATDQYPFPRPPNIVSALLFCPSGQQHDDMIQSLDN